MPWVCLTRVSDAKRAIVPIGAIQAFVTHTTDILYHFSHPSECEEDQAYSFVNYLFTSIAGCAMANVSAWFAQFRNIRPRICGLACRHQSMVWMMPMFHANKTSCAEVVIVADCAGIKVFLEKNCGTLALRTHIRVLVVPETHELQVRLSARTS